MHSTPQKSPPPLETMSQIAESVIPDESAMADEIRNPVKTQYDQISFGSRLAFRLAELARDDEFRHNVKRVEGLWSCLAEQKK